MTKDLQPQFAPWLPPFDVVPFFNPQQCADLIAKVELERTFKPASVMRPNGTVEVAVEHCTAGVVGYQPGSSLHSSVRSSLVEKLESFNKKYQFRLFDDTDKDLVPSILILRYDDSCVPGKFNPHIDVGGFTGVEFRKLSLVIPLNDPSEYEGGRLMIDIGTKYDAMSHCAQGDAIVFCSMTMHSVTPVTRGTRYSLVAFLQGPHFQ